MEPTLSAATLEALKLFALSSGIDVGSSGDEIVSAVRDHFDVQDKDQTFHYEYKNESREVRFSVKGVKRELGQTLSSTGLTM